VIGVALYAAGCCCIYLPASSADNCCTRSKSDASTS
jgi:hypothetical protein